MGNHSDTEQHMVRMGFGDGLGSAEGTTSKRSYSKQYFTYGGIDFIAE